MRPDLFLVPAALPPGLLDGYHGRYEWTRGGSRWSDQSSRPPSREGVRYRLDTRHPEVRDHLIRYFDGAGVSLDHLRDQRGGLEPWVSAALLWAWAVQVAAGEVLARNVVGQHLVHSWDDPDTLRVRVGGEVLTITRADYEVTP